MVLYGDMPFIKAESIKNLIASHEGQHAVFSMFTTKVPNFEGTFGAYSVYGRIIRNKEGKIVAIKEFADASETERQITEINPGIYMFRSSWLKDNLSKIKPNNKLNEYYLTDIVEVATTNGVKINSFEIQPEEVFGINNPVQLKAAESLLV